MSEADVIVNVYITPCLTSLCSWNTDITHWALCVFVFVVVVVDAIELITINVELKC